VARQHARHLTAVERPEEEATIGGKGTFEQVRISDILIDRDYQRRIRESYVRYLIEQFDEALFHVLYLNRRADGVLACMDGQHRVETAIRLHLHKRRAPAFVTSGLSKQEEARVYLKINQNRLPASGPDAFRAKLEAGEADATEIAAVTDQRGLSLVEYHGELRAREIMAYGTLYMLRKYGTLIDVLDTIIAAWPDEPTGFKALHMRGVDKLIRVSRHAIDLEHLAETMATEGPSKIEARALFYKSSVHSSPTAAFARALHWFYRHHGGKIAEWGDSDNYLGNPAQKGAEQ
jgi:hypothetical protein